MTIQQGGAIFELSQRTALCLIYQQRTLQAVSVQTVFNFYEY